MNRIEQLIQQYCPDGVEYKFLKDIAHVTIGEFVHKDKQNDNAMYPVFNGGRTNTGFYEEYNNTGNKIIMSARGANAGFVNKILVDYWAGNSCYSIEIKEETNWVFVYYILKQNQNKFINEQQTGSIPAVSKKQVENFSIPIPPLPIQQEIVSILDKFTSLEAELEAELEARTRQYDYYRNQLLNFEGKEGEWKTLGEIGEFIRGNGLQKKDFTESGVGCIHYGQIYTYYGTFTDKTKSFVSVELAKTLQKVNKGDLIITNTSENMEDVCKAVAWLGDDEIVTGGHATIFKHKENPKYLAYYMQTFMFMAEKKKYVTGTKVIDVSAKNLGKIIIPIPPLAEQNRIVAILDKFEVLINDISEGLPAEIKMRRQQYEHYRGKLLNFKNVNN